MKAKMKLALVSKTDTKLELARKLNPGAFFPDDKFVVYNKLTGAFVESHSTYLNAKYAKDVCNEHEERNYRPRCYTVVKIK